MKTLGTYVVDALAARGVRHVFGIPGVHNLELYRGLASSPIRHVTGRHEQGVGFMADGYARVSGLPGVCFTISGPGLTNIATAMGQAYADSVPLLVISSQNRRGDAGSGRGFLHELPDQCALASGVAAASFPIRQAQELPVALGQAFELFASARPRPVYIEIPLDLLATDGSDLPPPEVSSRPSRPQEQSLESALARLRSARRRVILAGGGAVRAAAVLRKLAERLDAPVVMTVNGRGILPAGHPLAVPMSPSLPPIRELIASAEVVLAVGTEMGPTDYDINVIGNFPEPPNLIRIDIDGEQMHRGATPVVGVCSNAIAALMWLESFDYVASSDTEGSARAARARQAGLEAITAVSPQLRHHVQVLDVIRDTLPTAVLVGDSTQLVYGGNLGFNAAFPGAWFNSATGYGTLGYALPASTGAGLAAADRPIVCIVGDGGLQFSLAELAVLADVDAWTAIIIWNNGGYGEIRTSMLAVGIEPEGVDVAPPDFSHIARAYRYPYLKVTSRSALEAALASFGTRRQILIIEIPADTFS